MKLLEVVYLGMCDYAKAYEKQKQLVEDRKADRISDTLIFVEHPEVYTFGRKTEKLPDGVESVCVERGGEGTLHNPGQLVVYPILKLDHSERDLHQYLRKLEETVIDCLQCFEISGERVLGATGVWLDHGSRKIASVGVAVSSWVTYHGVAINVSNDLVSFRRIQPCGFSPTVMTSIERENWPDSAPEMKQVQQEFLRCFSNNFHRRTKIFPGRVALSEDTLWRLSV